MDKTVTRASDEPGRRKDSKSTRSWIHNLAWALAMDLVFEVGTPHLHYPLVGSRRISFAVATPNRIVASPLKTRLER